MVQNVSTNAHCIYNMHWQRCRRKFVKCEHHIFKETTFLPVHPLISVKIRELMVVIISSIKNYICVTTPKNRSVLGPSLTAEIPHWLDKNVTSSDITQHKTSPLLTDLQTTCILLMRLRTLSSANVLMAPHCLLQPGPPSCPQIRVMIILSRQGDITSIPTLLFVALRVGRNPNLPAG